MNRREFFAMTAGAALGGIVAGAVANQLTPARPAIVPACMEMSPDLPQSNTAQLMRSTFPSVSEIQEQLANSAMSAVNVGASIRRDQP
jgi:esterase/lipase